MREFEWSDDKAAANKRKHGVAFAAAQLDFDDPFAVISIDGSTDYGEERMTATGWAGRLLLTVVYVERDNRIRIISARRATSHERRTYQHGDLR